MKSSSPPRRKLLGRRFGKLIVTGYAGGGVWLTRCDCGGKNRVLTRSLTSGTTRSCGCGRVGARQTPAPPAVPNAGWLPLTRGTFALVDQADYGSASRYRWRLECRRRASYASTHIAGRTVFLHRWLMDAKVGQQVDHWSGDGLDCRRANLRIATASQQAANSRSRQQIKTSRFKGVYWRIAERRWIAEATLNGRKYTRRCRSELAAAAAYNDMAKRLFGEFARVNSLA